jgi:hypothetical protein
MLASLHGTEPATYVPNVWVPLVFDRYTKINLLPRYHSAIVPVLGVLDSEGEGHVEIQVGKLHGRGFWVGRTIHHAYILLDEKLPVTFVSNAVALTILP